MKSYLLTMTPLIAGILITLSLSAMRGTTAASARRLDRASLILSLISLILPAILLVTLIPGTRLFGGSLLFTESGRAFAAVFFVLTAFILLLTHGYFQKIHVHSTDWRLIVLCMALGAFHLIFANDLPTIFVAFQLVSVPTYALIGLSRSDRRSNEAGMKYLILGLVTGAFFLLGISFLYGATGAINLTEIRTQLFTPFDAPAGDSPVGVLRDLGIIAMILFFTALFFKTATAPFHSYLLDVYQGSSFAAMVIVAGPAKVAYFALLSRLLHGPFADFAEVWQPLIAVGAVLSFAFGGLQGLAQTNLKRILACSSVINTGFIILAIAFADSQVVAFYLLAYGLMTIALLGFLLTLGRQSADIDTLADVAGLGKRKPPVAVGLTITLLSFAGIPLTAGFLSKLFVLLGVFENNVSFAAIVAGLGVIGSALAAYFYFAVIRAIWFHSEAPDIPAEAGGEDSRWNYRLVAWLAVALIVLLGVYPFPLIR